jgi:DNA-binding SARP family transcriptional activator/pimeloyl-ACP methyl ester carboxylesterase
MPTLTIALLGAFQARLEPDGPLTFRTRKAQALLAYLALDPGRAHLRDDVAALLWGDVPDGQARTSLRHALYELRQTCAALPGVIRIEGDALSVDTALVDVDVARFTRLLDDGTPQGLAQAVALYRGDLLSGLSVKAEAWEDWIREERERLRERAIEALARVIVHHRQGDRLDEAARAAQRLLALDPLAEPVHRSLMRLYADLGRRGAALRQYQHCVSVLQRELGVEPEVETQQLYRQILQQRAAPRPAPTIGLEPGEMRPLEGPLIGRTDELRRLRDAFQRASAGHGGLVAVLGEAGIGKSRLVEELIADAGRAHARVLVGRAYESDQILLLGPVVDALRTGRVSRSAEILDTLDPPWRSELGRLLPESAAPTPLPARGDYRRLFEAIAHLVAGLAHQATVLLVLEDLHWADELTVRLLAFLARRVHGQRALIIATAREEELEDAALLRRTLADLEQGGQLASMSLGPLSREDTEALVGVLVRPGGPLPRRDRVWSISGGNPLVVVELMRTVPEGTAPDELTLPRKAREVIDRRLDRLDQTSRLILTVAAAIGREFEFELLRDVVELDDDGTARGVEELVRRRLLTTVGERLAFAHERIREVVYGTLPPWRRVRLHRRIAETIESREAARLPEVWEALAEHWERSHGWPQAAGYHLRVAERAKQRLAYATAERSCRRAVDAAANPGGDAALSLRALELLGDILSLRGEVDGANESYEAAAKVPGGERERARIANKLHRPRLVSRDGAVLAFYEHGSGDETLLLTNPIIYGLEILQPVLEQLCQEFRIITMDLRGTGRSHPIPASYTTGAHAADIGAVIEAAGGGPVTAIGISKSGNMLVRLAVTAPALVKRLVLIGTPLDITPGSVSLVPSEVDDAFRAALRAGDLPSAMHHFAATVVSDPDTGELAEQFTRNLLRLPRESILSTWSPDPELDIAPVLGAVTASTLVLHGTEDRRVSVAAARYLAAHIPDARLHLFEGRGHLPLFTATTEFCEVLRSFIRGDAPHPLH